LGGGGFVRFALLALCGCNGGGSVLLISLQITSRWFAPKKKKKEEKVVEVQQSDLIEQFIGETRVMTRKIHMPCQNLEFVAC
jgi:hypothetical protein